MATSTLINATKKFTALNCLPCKSPEMQVLACIAAISCEDHHPRLVWANAN